MARLLAACPVRHARASAEIVQGPAGWLPPWMSEGPRHIVLRCFECVARIRGFFERVELGSTISNPQPRLSVFFFLFVQARRGLAEPKQ